VNRLVRACGLVLVSAAAVGSLGCFQSDNEGQLEGTKWASAYVPEFHGVKGATATLQFTEDGRFTMELRVPQRAVRMSGRWRTGPGSVVYLEEVTPAFGGQTTFVESVVISGDVLTLRETSTKIVFTRVTEDMEKAAKGDSKPAANKPPTQPDGPGETTGQSGRGQKSSNG
jgi:hypothetical protein